MARYLQTNETAIRTIPIGVLASFYLLKANNPNSILYPSKQGTAAKLGVDRSTVSRWISTLVHHGLAVRRETGHVVLATLEEAIALGGGNQGHKGHKCTLRIERHYDRQDIEKQLRKKLLEEAHRQVLHAVRETEIDNKMQKEYGHIANDRIRRMVKSRVYVMPRVGAPMSAKSIAKKLGISERRWYRLSAEWKQDRSIDSLRQEESLDLWMTPSEYVQARPHFGFATKRKRTGEILRVKPNLIHIEMNYAQPKTANDIRASKSATSSPSPLNGWSFRFCPDERGGGFLIAVPPANGAVI